MTRFIYSCSGFVMFGKNVKNAEYIALGFKNGKVTVEYKTNEKRNLASFDDIKLSRHQNGYKIALREDSYLLVPRLKAL